MDSEKHIPLGDLIKELEKGIEGLNSGGSSKDAVHELHLLSRELHERLTVLRFKAFEASSSKLVNLQELDEDFEKSQTNLIDAIKEVSLAEKHMQKPLSSVSEGLTILERANYTSILFSNDNSSFNDMLDAVDECSGIDEAQEAFRNSIKPTGRKEDIELAQITFEERIPRIFTA